MNVDRYSRAVVTLIRHRYDEWEADPPRVHDHMRRPTEQRTLAKVTSVHGAEVPVEDEDWPARTFAEKAIHLLFRSPVYPLSDDPTPWSSASVAVSALTEWLTPRLLPPEGVHWDELQSDAAQSRFAFAGLAAPWLVRTREGFEVDFDWMSNLDVREGFSRYGATARFDPDRRLQSIRRLGRDIAPGDAGWDEAKFAWRSSVFVGVTLAYHVWALHLYAANRVVTATREQLPPEHPLRLLLKPFSFRTVAINHRASATLLVPRGLLHRAFGLTWDAFAASLRYGDDDARLRPVRSRLAERGTLGLADFPYGEDACALEEVLRRYVERFTALHVDISDPFVGSWWSALGELVPPLRAHGDLVDAVTAFMFAATGQHRHIGTMREYTLDPSFVAGRIREGSLMNDQEGSRILMLSVAGTGLRQPALLSDFSHLLPLAHESETRGFLDAMQADLRALSEVIVEKNRSRPWPYTGMDPARLECSVAI